MREVALDILSLLLAVLAGVVWGGEPIWSWSFAVAAVLFVAAVVCRELAFAAARAAAFRSLAGE
mgnify:CR=1 FL=1